MGLARFKCFVNYSRVSGRPTKYATEKTRNIGENVPFAIIGCTQVPFAGTFNLPNGPRLRLA